MSKSLKITLIAIAVVQLLVTTVVAYNADRVAHAANMKVCAVAALTVGADYEKCLTAKL